MKNGNTFLCTSISHGGGKANHMLAIPHKAVIIRCWRRTPGPV